MASVDKNYCLNSFLQFRFVYNEDKLFKKDLIPYHETIEKKYNIGTVEDLEKSIKEYINENVDSKTALMLSSGIDSAILAKYLPKNAMTFTLKCIADEPTVDETVRAKQIAKINGLKNEVIEVSWEDYEKYIPVLLNHKKAPFHSIEVQIYKAALRVKELGYDKLLFGESADTVFGGLSGLLSKDWTFDEFVNRYNFVPVDKVLSKPNLILEPYKEMLNGDIVDAHKFINKYFFKESYNSYCNACGTAKVEYLSPYTCMQLIGPLDLTRVRNGDSKYLIKELFRILYPDLDITKKIPMPRPTELWFKNWEGPKRKEFKNLEQVELTGDQKWLIYILERFLNHFDVEE